MRTLTLVVAALCVVACTADVYMQYPRGSNNRLNEENRDRTDANRLFDSQNNNRGGFNVGSVYYYTGSDVNFEWTNQHSCGNPNNRCEMIIQYMCDPLLRDGTTTDQIPATPGADKTVKYGRHESEAYYAACNQRERNHGLFTANQNLNGNSAIYTRQNANGGRSGLECPEERDYYPYWAPTPWVDIAILTNDASRCQAYVAASENTNGRWYCAAPPGYLAMMSGNGQTGYIPALNGTACNAISYFNPMTNLTQNGVWTQAPANGAPAPDCRATEWTRDNHLGNVHGGFPATYNWTVPTGLINERCAFRLRYNVTTYDWQVWQDDFSVTSSATTNSSVSYRANDQSQDPALLDVWSQYGLDYSEVAYSFRSTNPQNARGDQALKMSRDYVVKNNPRVNIFGGLIPSNGVASQPNIVRLQLAINTNQFGRTFQDRSYRTAFRAPSGVATGTKIHNLQVQGKRGNIVQTFPGTEYDFWPMRLELRTGSYIHFQWTGSNTSPDGAGQGNPNTDRHNALLLSGPIYDQGQGTTNPPTFGQFSRTYPARIDNASMPFLGLSLSDRKKLAITTDDSTGQMGGNMDELNDAGAYFDLGLRQVSNRGIYHYVCTRNNNFSNRDQKAKIVVGDQEITNYFFDSNQRLISTGTGESMYAAAGAFATPTTVSLVSADPQAQTSFSGTPASEYLQVMPQNLPLVQGAQVTLYITYTTNPVGYATTYYATDLQAASWSSYPADYSNGVATIQTNKGGVFVVQTTTNWGAIVGATLGGLGLIGLCVYGAYRKMRPPVAVAESKV